MHEESLLERLSKESIGKKVVSVSQDMYDLMFNGIYPFEPEKERHIDRVIFENGYTIILDSEGNRFLSRPEKGEKYDEEKGLLVALAKYDGHSTSEILELLKGAVRKNGNKDKKPVKKKKV